MSKMKELDIDRQDRLTTLYAIQRWLVITGGMTSIYCDASNNRLYDNELLYLQQEIQGDSLSRRG